MSLIWQRRLRIVGFFFCCISCVCVCVCVLLAVARGLFKQVALCAVISLEIPTLMAATRHPFYLLIFTIRLARLVAFLRLVFFLRRRLRWLLDSCAFDGDVTCLLISSVGRRMSHWAPNKDGAVFFFFFHPLKWRQSKRAHDVAFVGLFLPAQTLARLGRYNQK